MISRTALTTTRNSCGIAIAAVWPDRNGAFQGSGRRPDGALFFADRITYDFAAGSPTPEPASLLLLGTGAAGLLARRRVRRNREG